MKPHILKGDMSWSRPSFKVEAQMDTTVEPVAIDKNTYKMMFFGPVIKANCLETNIDTVTIRGYVYRQLLFLLTPFVLDSLSCLLNKLREMTLHNYILNLSKLIGCGNK